MARGGRRVAQAGVAQARPHARLVRFGGRPGGAGTNRRGRRYPAPARQRARGAHRGPHPRRQPAARRRRPGRARRNRRGGAGPDAKRRAPSRGRLHARHAAGEGGTLRRGLRGPGAGQPDQTAGVDGPGAGPAAARHRPRCARAASTRGRARGHRGDRLSEGGVHPGLPRLPRRRRPPPEHTDLHRRPAALGIDPDRTDPVQPPQGPGTG